MPDQQSFSDPSFLDDSPPDDFLLYPKDEHYRISSINTNTLGASRNSSWQKVWAEDYYNIDSGRQIDSTTIQGVPSIVESEGRDQDSSKGHARTHSRSIASLLPFRNTTKGSRSPERNPQSPEKEEFMPTLTGDKDGLIKVADKSKGIASWFSGSSAPVPIGVPHMADEEVADPKKRRPTIPTSESSWSTNTTPTKAATPAKGTIFGGFFSPKAQKPAAIQIPAYLADEYTTLDIDSALFPSGRPLEQDPFSPAAFKNLLQNAEGLLLRIQHAYQLRTLSLHELTAEKGAVEEELEEARMKNNLLKANLSSIAAQVSERDATIAELLGALTAERQARSNEKEARERSLSIIKGRADQRGSSASRTSIDTTAEDLGIATAGKRQSTQTDCSESDAESRTGDSTFSRSRSPVSSISSNHEVLQATVGKMVPNPAYTSGYEARPKLVQQPSTFETVLQDISDPDSTPKKDREKMVMECSNCKGQDASVAWATVGMMKMEKEGLKEWIGELERCVEEVGDIVGGLGMVR